MLITLQVDLGSQLADQHWLTAITLTCDLEEQIISSWEVGTLCRVTIGPPKAIRPTLAAVCLGKAFIFCGAQALSADLFLHCVPPLMTRAVSGGHVVIKTRVLE